MSAAASLSGSSLTAVHAAFLAALPSIDDVLRYQFRMFPAHRRAEAIADARAACWHAWHGLLRRGQDPVAVGPTGIAANAARYVKNGRRLGTGTGGRGSMDVYNKKAQKKLGLKIVSLDRDTETEVDGRSEGWRGWFAEDNRLTPAEEACFRLDFQTWLETLPCRKRRMAELLAEGHGTGEVASLLGVTPPAVSIARTWLEASWRTFQGEVGDREDDTMIKRPVGRPRKAAATA